jgi:hypothetical protein
MIVGLAMVLILAAVAAGIAAFARFVGRPIPTLLLAAFVLAAMLPSGRAWVSDRSILPLDHTQFVRPWLRPEMRPPYNPNLNDVATMILPWTEAVRRAWLDGELPLRDRWNGCGTPLAANSLSAAFSPLTLLALLLPLARVFTLIAAIKILLAAVGAWLWIREIGATSRAAAFGGVAFGLSLALAPPWLLYPHSSVLCLWPWTLFLIERLRDGDARFRSRTIGALAGVFALEALAGHPETLFVGLAFAAVWMLLRIVFGDPIRPRRWLVAVLAAGAIGAGLTAFLLIPSALAILASGRMAQAHRAYWEPVLSLLPHGPLWRPAATSLFPHVMGNGIASPMLPLDSGAFPETALGYFGIVAWAAALLCLRPGSPRPRVERALLVLLALGWTIATGVWPVAEIFSRTPAFRLIFPLRFHLWESLAGPAIAALELDRFARDARASGGRRPWIAAAVIAAALAAAGFALFRAFAREHAASGPYAVWFQHRQLLVVTAVLAAFAVSAFLLRRLPELWVAAISLLCGAELLYQWRIVSRPLYDPAELFPKTPLIRFLDAQARPFRVAGEGPALFPSTNVFAGVEDVRTHDAVERRDYLDFLDATCGYRYEYFKILRNLDAPALDFLNVRYVLAGPQGHAPGTRWDLAYEGPDGRLFENGNVLPRAFVPERVRFVAPQPPGWPPAADANALFGGSFREIAGNADWRQTAWVLDPGGTNTEGGDAAISEYAETTNAASFTANVKSREAWVVLSLVQDGGWSARDDSGRPLELRRANGPFLALHLPDGPHRVRLRYVPPGFAAGAVISAATLLIVLLAAGRRRVAPK